MTSPDNVTPSQAYQSSQLYQLQDEDNQAGYQVAKNAWFNAKINTLRTNLFTNLMSGHDNVGGALDEYSGGLSLALTGLLGGLSQIASWAAGINSGIDYAVAAGSVAESLAGHVVATGQIDGFTFQRDSYTTNGSWSPPTPPTGTVLDHYEVQVINGGGGGGRPANWSTASDTGTYPGGPGGQPGGLNRKPFAPSDISGTVAITIGAGGAGRTSGTGYGQSGGASLFGALLSTTTTIGVIYTMQGSLFSADAPGKGGDGGWVQAVKTTTTVGTITSSITSANVIAPGDAGGASSAGAGGAGGYAGTGWWGSGAVTPGNGAPGSADGTVVKGGSGGGGGGGSASAGAAYAAGGIGAAPGGGGGGGGCGSNDWLGGNGSGPGGNGGNGRVDVITFFRAAS